MIDFNDKEYNGELLLDELLDAGLNPSDVRVYTNGEGFNCRVEILVEDADSIIEDTINAVAQAHDSTIQSKSERVQQIANNAKQDIENIPAWASWDATQATDWIDANVTDLQSARTALKAMARMLIALRNKIYPDLQE